MQFPTVGAGGGVGQPPVNILLEKQQLINDIEAYKEDPSQANLNKVEGDIKQLQSQGRLRDGGGAILLDAVQSIIAGRADMNAIAEQLQHATNPQDIAQLERDLQNAQTQYEDSQHIVEQELKTIK